jgi:hypothetical protein
MAEDEDWRKPCEAAGNEKDSVKLLQITAQINRILAERERDSRVGNVQRVKARSETVLLTSRGSSRNAQRRGVEAAALPRRPPGFCWFIVPHFGVVK